MAIPKTSLRDLCREVGVEHIQVTEVLRRVNRAVMEGNEVITQEVGTFKPVDRKATTKTLNGEVWEVPARRVVGLRPPKSEGVLQEEEPVVEDPRRFQIAGFGIRNFSGSAFARTIENGFDVWSFGPFRINVAGRPDDVLDRIVGMVGDLSIYSIEGVFCGFEFDIDSYQDPSQQQLFTDVPFEFGIDRELGVVYVTMQYRWVDDGRFEPIGTPGVMTRPRFPRIPVASNVRLLLEPENDLDEGVQDS